MAEYREMAREMSFSAASSAAVAKGVAPAVFLPFRDAEGEVREQARREATSVASVALAKRKAKEAREAGRI